MFAQLPEDLKDLIEKVSYVSQSDELPLRERTTKAVTEWAWYIKSLALMEWEVEEFKYFQEKASRKTGANEKKATSTSGANATDTSGVSMWATKKFPKHKALFAEHARIKELKSQNAKGSEATPSEAPAEGPGGVRQP